MAQPRLRVSHWLVLLLAAFVCGVAAVELDRADEAEVYSVGQIRIIDPWAKSSGSGAREAKLFFEFQNRANIPDKLTDARSPIASGPTNFRVVHADDAGRRVAKIDGIEIPVSEKSFEMTEVGYYIELSGLELPVLMGSRFPVELKFERAGRVTVEFVARFHSPKLVRRIRAAAARGDVDALKALRPAP